MAKIYPEFASEIKKFGAGNFDACYNCGNCTATCELTEQNAVFPRFLIRLGILGRKDEILGSKELWLCYACGECTENCPRQADPGEYMAALRRFAIANYEPTGLTRFIFKNNIFSLFITLAVSIILGCFLLTIKSGNDIARWIFRYLPYEVIHNAGITIFLITGLSVIWGMTSLWRRLSKQSDRKAKNKYTLIESVSKVLNELAVMKRYRTCNTEEEAFWKSKSPLVKPWFIHWSVMWGFIGLLLATVIDFLFKDPSTSILLPSRLLGTVAGIFLMYGSGMAIGYRFKKITRTYADSKLADWIFLIFLWIAGLTGFWLEIAVTLNSELLINNIVFVCHTIVSMELVLLFAFSKFAHAVYRPLALFIYYYKS